MLTKNLEEEKIKLKILTEGNKLMLSLKKYTHANIILLFGRLGQQSNIFEPTCFNLEISSFTNPGRGLDSLIRKAILERSMVEDRIKVGRKDSSVSCKFLISVFHSLFSLVRR